MHTHSPVHNVHVPLAPLQVRTSSRGAAGNTSGEAWGRWEGSHFKWTLLGNLLVKLRPKVALASMSAARGIATLRTDLIAQREDHCDALRRVAVFAVFAALPAAARERERLAAWHRGVSADRLAVKVGIHPSYPDIHRTLQF